MLFTEYISSDILCLSSLYYNLLFVNNKIIKKFLLAVLKSEISGQGLSIAMCLALKNIVGCRLTEDEIGIIENYLNTNDFKSYLIFWKEHCDAVGFLLMAFDKQVHRESIDSAVNEYVITYKNYFRLLNGSCTISKFVSSIKRNLNGNSESIYYIRILLGKFGII